MILIAIIGMFMVSFGISAFVSYKVTKEAMEEIKKATIEVIKEELPKIIGK